MSREAFLLMACIQLCRGNWGLNMPVDVLRGSRVRLPMLAEITFFDIAGVRVWSIEPLLQVCCGMSKVSILGTMF